MASYHTKTDYQTAQMLVNIEAQNREVVQAYYERFGIDELPVPLPKEGNDRQYRVWVLEPIIVEGEGVQGYAYRHSHVPADKGGYIQALTQLASFDAVRPEGIYDVHAKRTDTEKAGRGAKKSG